MKKLKLFLCVALFGAMSFGAFSAYDYYTMSAEEMALLENTEALTAREPGGGGGSDAYVECRCTSAVSTSTNGCYADGKANVCHGAVNARCWEYHLNCKTVGV